jgi:predicted Zn-dependent peptidase
MSIPGITLTYGNLSIQTPAGSSHNAAKVSIDPATKNVAVSLNGASEQFAASLVFNMTYMGGTGGSDTFENDTKLTALCYGFKSGNTYTGGTGFNFVYFYAGGNTYNTQAGSFSDVFEVGGVDTVNNPSKATVQLFKY